MFERREQRTFPGTCGSLFPYACDYWRVQGFSISQPEPYHMHGEHYRSTLGLRRVCDLYLKESDGQVWMDVVFRARITDEGAVVGAAAAVVFLPVAVVGGAISYSEYEDDANRMLSGFWNYMGTVSNCLSARGSPPAPQHVQSRFAEPQGPTPASPEAPRAPEQARCPKCERSLDPDWKVCPECGTNVK